MTIKINPDGYGFTYRISSNDTGWYRIYYVAVGTGGHQLSGELEGEIGDSKNSFGFLKTHFPVIHAGVKEFEFQSYMGQTEHKSIHVKKNLQSESRQYNTEIDANLRVPSEKPDKPHGNYTGTPYY